MPNAAQKIVAKCGKQGDWDTLRHIFRAGTRYRGCCGGVDNANRTNFVKVVKNQNYIFIMTFLLRLVQGRYYHCAISTCVA
jgi:hypothetical protein